ncbi:carbonic anhydrase [bacterium]|nr:carbonic anhydrase [bacterium]
MPNLEISAKNELEKLLKGNENFIAGKPTAKNMCLKTLQSLALYQEPYACVLSCSDSRVVPEIIFDCGIGELFVVRVAGITVGPNVKESIEYAVKKLHVPLLILLGHDDCGVMKFASEQYPNIPDDFQSILKCVYPVIDGKGKFDCNNEFARKHTIWVEEYLLNNSKIIKEAVDENKLYIAKCHFDHNTGKVSLL